LKNGRTKKDIYGQKGIIKKLGKVLSGCLIIFFSILVADCLFRMFFNWLKVLVNG